MAATPDPSTRRWRAWIVMGLLLLTLALTGLLAWEAFDAARSHREATENALGDYTAFAAWQFGRQGERALFDALHRPLHPIAHMELAPGELPVPGGDSDTLDCGCAQSSVQARSYFRLDLAPEGSGGDALRITGEPSAPSVRDWLRDTVAAHARLPRSRADRPLGFIADELAGRHHLIVFDRGRHDPDAIYGYLTYAVGIGPAMRSVARTATLLPPSLLTGAPDSLFSIGVFLNGREVYRSGEPTPAGQVTTDTLDRISDGLVARVKLNRAAAGQLLIGGVPESNLPLLLGLLALVVGLVFVALYQLRRQHELARLRSDFVSGVSHELRTPLAQIRMFAETLLLGRVRSDGERRQALEIIDKEATRLTGLVENVLRFSRAERDASRVDPEPTVIAGELREAIESFTQMTESRDVTIRAELDDEIVAPADREALRQMLLNLLDNAVKYGPERQVVTVGLVRIDDTARIRVADQGPGVPREERERIFAAFQRLDRPVESTVGGSGIGLSVVRELAQLHGGSAGVEDAPGGGAVFTITLPDARRIAAASASRRPSDEVGAVA